jgi:hypothetical protein
VLRQFVRKMKSQKNKKKASSGDNPEAAESRELPLPVSEQF